MSRQTEKRNIALFAAEVLLCLTIFTTYLTGGLYARYATSAQGSDSARAAAYVLDVQAGELAVKLPQITKPGDTETVSITISNKRGNLTSEVAETYAMTIRELGSLPLTYTLTESGSISAAPTPREITANGEFAASVANSKTYDLTVAWPADKKEPIYAGGTASLKLTITGEQID